MPAIAVSVRRLTAAGIDGKWQGEVPGMQGPVSTTFDLKAEADKLTGTIESDMGQAEIQDGKMMGDEVSFVQVLSRGDMQIRITYAGKLAGDELELTRTVQRPGGGPRPGGQGGPQGGGRPNRQGGARPGGPGGGRQQRAGGGQQGRGGRGGAPAVTFTLKRAE